MVTTLQVRLLGDFSVARGETPLTGIGTGRLQLLFAYLIVHHGAPRSRQQIAFQFWPDSTEAQARTNLRQLVHGLRRSLPEAEWYLQADARALQWRAESPATVDVVEFERALERAAEAERLGDEQERGMALEEAAALYGGDLLPGHYDEWLLRERDRLRDQYASVLAQLIASYEQQGDYPAAIRYAQALLSHDPLREATYRDLMRLHSLNGDRASALRVYRECAATLRRELGVDPDPATRAVHDRIEQAEAPPSVDGEIATPSSPPLFGRDAEWGRLLAAWSAATSGRPRLALITGEAGIGKTRLAEELLIWSSRHGIASARARSYPAEGRLAYGPVTDWLRSRDIRAGLSRLDPVWRTEVARLLPEMLAEQPDLPPPEPLLEGWQRQHLFAALARATVGMVQPLLLLVDDLQWSDQDTLEWLHYLLRFDPDASLLVLATVRTGELRSRHPLQMLIHELRREDLVIELALGPLDSEATRQLARHLTGEEVDAGAAGRLYRNTEGNPLFIVETVRAGGGVWLDEGRPSPGSSAFPGVPADMDVALPPRVHGVISGRLAQLSPAAQDLAGLAATVGRAFTSAVVIEASEGDEDEVSDALDELWRRLIVREQAEGLFDFSHEKIREVAYAEVSPARRALLHRRVARALEYIHNENLSPVSAQLAAHYERAGMLDEAIRYYQRAAELAQRVYAHSEAIGLLQRGIATLLRQPKSPARDARELELQIALSSSLYSFTGFGAPEGGEVFGVELDEVFSRTQALSHRLGVPVDPRVLRSQAIVHIARGQVRPSLDFGAQLLKIAQDAGDEPVLHTEAHYVIGVASHWLGRFANARKHLEAAIGFYDRQRHRIHAVQYGQDPGVVCRSRLAYTLLHLGYPEQALHWSRDALSLARELAYPNSLAYALNWTAWPWLELGDLEGAQALTTEVMDMAEEQQFGIWRHIGSCVLGWIAVRQGDAEGIPRIRHGISGNLSSAQLLHVPYMYALLVDAYRHLNAPKEGLAAVAEWLAVIEQTEIRFIEAELYRLRGELLWLQGADEAESAFHRALNIAREQQARLLELRSATSLARLLRDRGQGDEGRQALQAVYGWFTEGFDTPDLRAARGVLDTLAD